MLGRHTKRVFHRQISTVGIHELHFSISLIRRNEQRSPRGPFGDCVLARVRQLKNAADKAAADDHRTLTSLVEKLLTDYLRRKGYLK